MGSKLPSCHFLTFRPCIATKGLKRCEHDSGFPASCSASTGEGNRTTIFFLGATVRWHTSCWGKVIFQFFQGNYLFLRIEIWTWWSTCWCFQPLSAETINWCPRSLSPTTWLHMMLRAFSPVSLASYFSGMAQNQGIILSDAESIV